ncbi:arginine--tRNA ligase [Prosthecobacter vanneervenii]|uniref:Arginine--tRNA ligase n=1 Tax=Prosthecobacter vanneervenii TaxID=48466 RepID=A0A7W7YBR2_9BACT|nr:arginine--tRNA ligase [Prosthecobacter vanneervenii]MBB5033278.1 arginyl-tRNA synthetase [Prosthecobacter vanneervenii]
MFRALLTSRLQAAFTAAGIALPEGFTPGVVIASDTRFGDYQSNAAMILAKQLKMNPRALAEQIKAALQVEDLCEKVTVDGPGFLNLTLSAGALAQRLSVIVKDDHVGVPPVAQPKTIVVDFSAPNIAKPMHVGHIRSTFIGDSLARVARFIGHKVITDNHVGDWGTQFGMIIHGWKTQLDQAKLKADPIHELVSVYKAVNAATKADEAVLEICKGELVKLQQGDAENLSIWKECVRLTLEQLEKVYGALDIKFDHYLGESFYNDALAPLVADMLNQGIATISDGATVIFSDGSVKPENDPFLIREKDEWKAAPCIIRKGDGGFLYATTDLATIDYRVKEWKADEIWYVVGAPQQLHFRQVFAAAQRRGVTTKMIHIAFGSILGPDGKMFKTRSGETVGLLEVIDEAIERARAAADEKEQGLSDAEKDEIARIIGGGSVKYAELSQNRLTDYKFSWDKMLSLQGNTAPYLINAYVRTRSIFRKLDGQVTLTDDLAITEPAERALAMKLAQFAENAHDLLDDHRPNLLANYLYELANTYHSFYEACNVLRSEGTVRNTRLTLCEATGRVLKTGLGLLGIQTTERM